MSYECVPVVLYLGICYKLLSRTSSFLHLLTSSILLAFTIIPLDLIVASPLFLRACGDRMFGIRSCLVDKKLRFGILSWFLCFLYPSLVLLPLSLSHSLTCPTTILSLIQSCHYYRSFLLSHSIIQYIKYHSHFTWPAMFNISYDYHHSLLPTILILQYFI